MASRPTEPLGSSRRLTLADAMALVAAAAAGAATLKGSRWNPTSFFIFNGASGLPEYQPWRPEWVRLGVSLWITYLLPPVTCLTVATWMIRLRRPRPAFATLACQPGTAACVAVVSILLVNPVALLNQHFFGPASQAPYDLTFLRAHLVRWSSAMSSGVIAAWILLAMSRRWRAEPDWIDRLGRLIGVFWIASLPFSIGVR